MGAGKSLQVGHLARVASLTGIDPGWLSDLDEAQSLAVAKVAEDEARRRAWDQQTELLAQAVDTLRAIASQLGAGLPVQMVRRVRRPRKVDPVKRPDWVKEAATEASTSSGASPGGGNVLVVRPRELFGMMSKGG